MIKPNQETDWEKIHQSTNTISSCSVLLNDFYFLHFCFFVANILRCVPLILENTERVGAKYLSVLRCDKDFAFHVGVLRALLYL